MMLTLRIVFCSSLIEFWICLPANFCISAFSSIGRSRPFFIEDYSLRTIVLLRVFVRLLIAFSGVSNPLSICLIVFLAFELRSILTFLPTNSSCLVALSLIGLIPFSGLAMRFPSLSKATLCFLGDGLPPTPNGYMWPFLGEAEFLHSLVSAMAVRLRSISFSY